MSIEVLKAGISDSIQDAGRYGYQHLGINPTGVMDLWAMRVANTLVGNPAETAVLEMTFPAARLKFHISALIALAGADFQPTVNGHPVNSLQPLLVPAGAVLEFTSCKKGSFVYLAVGGGFRLQDWLGSYSTHTLVRRGGLNGAILQKGDMLPVNRTINHVEKFRKLPFRAHADDFYPEGAIKCLTVEESSKVSEATLEQFTSEKFYIHPQSNRMGYRLTSANPLSAPPADELSDVVTFGTIQLLPNGELMALMADHQTTGGYPPIARLAMAFRSAFVQRRPGESIEFEWTDIDEAQRLYVTQVRALQQLETSCRYHLKHFLHEAN
ncbi:MAG: biotin-dependent carboxyltransferase family protein [Cyclobacteriaceae bacterium]|nr:biotin-dependent carboxyltransferase family protein [Cyclobacteriaceae bacterium]